MVRLMLLLLLLVSSVALAQEPINTVQLQILGAALSVGPAQQTVPLQTPTVVHTHLGTAELPLVVDSSYVVKGELSGPQLPSPVTLTTHPNDDFQIPGLNLPGDYLLSDVRLEKEGRFIAYADPPQVGFLVKQILVTSVISRPLTLEEIQARGIVIDASSYKVVELAIGLRLESGTYDITFPIVWTAEGPQILSEGGGGVGGQNGPRIKGPKFNPPQIAPFELKVEWPAGEEDKSVPSVSIPGIIVIPTDIAFLNQFFSVMLMTTNDAPKGDPLVIRDLFAKLDLPASLREAQTNPPVPLGTFLPVRDPGPDEKLGTADDLTIIVAQATGNAEWNVEGLKEGNHIVNIRLEGILDGLAVGPVPIRSKAQGMVIVRDPQFAFNVSHPGVVRKDEEYDAYLTITNTSNTAANLLSVSIPQNQIVGSTLLDLEGPEGSQRPNSDTILVGTLAACESASVRLHLLATQTGQVTATAVRASAGTASVTLTLAVGERGVPLSPASLVFPAFIDSLPVGLTRYAIDLMGLGYSLATAPPGSVSADLPFTSESVIQQRGWELALAARYLQLGIDPFDAVAGFTLNWLGNREQDYGFDALRRTTAKGRRLNQEIKTVFEAHLAESGNGFGDLLSDLHAFQCQASPYIAVLLRGDPSAAALGILNRDTAQYSIGAYGETVYRREVSHAEIFSLSDGSGQAQLAILGAPYHWDGEQPVPYSYEIQVIGLPGAASAGENVSLSILRGDADGSFEILEYGAITVYPSPLPFALAPVSIAGAGGAAVMANGMWTTVNPNASPAVCPAFDAVAVVEDPYADPIGRALVVVFNQRPTLTGDPAEDLARFALSAHIDRAEVPIRDLVRELYSVKLQGDGRTAILSFKSPVSPWSTNMLSITGLDPANPGETIVREVIRPAEFQTAGAIVGGQVIGPDGEPVPNAPVELWETDRSDLDGTAFTHVTAVTTANAEGYYIFDYVRSKDPCLLRGYDPASGESGDIGYKTVNGAFHWLNIVMLARGNIRGIVSYPDGTIPAMARVIASSGVFGEHQTVGVTPVTGEYNLSRLPVGNISLTAQDNLGNTLYANAYLAYAGQIVVRDIVLSAKADPGVGSVRGNVYFADSTPVGGTWVGVYLAEGGGERLLGWGTTDETGQFGFHSIPEGAVYLKACDPRTQKVGGTVAVTVVRDAVVTADIAISDLFGGISGRITHRDGAEPVAGCTVYLYNSAWVTSTDADGEFRFEALPLGAYRVEALYLPERERGSKNVSLSSPGEEASVLIDISNSTGGIVGTVKDGQGALVAQATVSIVVGGYPARVTRTSASGDYAFSDLPAGSYKLQAYSSTVNAGEAEGAIRYNGETVVTDIVLSGSRTISLAARMSTSVEGEYSWVKAPFKYRSRVVNEYGVIEWMNGWLSGGTTNKSGTPVTFGPVMVGPVQIVAGDPSFGQKSLQITLAASDPEPYTQIVTLDALCTVSGTILSWSDGVMPVNDRSVTVTFKGGDGLPRPVTTTNGTFEFPLVSAGSFEITATDGLHWGYARGDLAFAGQILEGMEIRLLRVGRVEVEVLAPADAQHPGPWPVTGAEVHLKETHKPWKSYQGTTLDPGPAMVVDQVNEGRFSVTATWLDSQSGATHTLAGRANGTVVDEQGTVRIQVFLGEYARLHGLVINPETYSPVPYAQVRLDGTASDYTTTGADGNFSLSYLPLGTYEVSALDPASGRSGRASGIVLDAQDEDPNVEILLESTGGVKGDVVYPDHLTVSPFAIVKLTSRGIEPFNTLTSADLDGRFSFVGISRGPFDLYACALDGPRQGKATDELFTEGETREVNIVLQAAGQVAGRITDWNGMPMDGSALEFKTEFAQQLLNGNSWRTQQAGTQFVYEEVLAGKEFTIAANELVYPFHKGRATGTVEEEGQVVELDVKLYPIGDVEVFVQGADGSPAGAVEVSLNNSGPYKDFVGYTATTAEGYRRWDDIGYGDFTITARKWIAASGSFIRGSGHGHVETDGGLTTVTITLEATASAVGTVFLPDGNRPAAGAHVYIHSGTRTLYFRTNSDGWFVDGDNNPALGYQSIPTGPFWIEVIQDQGTGYYRLDSQSVAAGEMKSYTNENAIILDGDALMVNSFLPISGASQVEADASQVQIIVEFNDAIRPESLSGTCFKLKKGSQYVALASVTYAVEEGSPAAHKVRLVPGQNLASSSVYSIEVSKDVKEDSGKTLGVTLYSSFTTRDSAPPVITAVEPPADSDCHHPMASGNLVTVVLTSSEPLDPSSVNAQTVVVSMDGGNPLSGYCGLELNNTRIRFTSTEPLQAAARYTVTVLGIKDAAGNILSQAGIYKFCTRDSSNPQVTILLDSRIQNNTVIEGQSYTLKADAGGAMDIDRVEWSVNGGAVIAVTESPYIYSVIAPSPASISVLNIQARAFDYSGNSGSATATLIVIANAPPVIVDFSVDYAGQEVHAGDVVKAVSKAYDDVNLMKITLVVWAPGGTEMIRLDKTLSGCTNPASPCSASFSYTMPAGASPGTWTFQMEARDNMDAVTISGNLSVIVPPPAEMGYPMAAFLCPTDGAILPTGYFPALIAHIEDAQGLKRVEIERDGVLFFSEDYVSGTSKDVMVQETVALEGVRNYKVKVMDTNDQADEDVITVTSVTGPAIPNGADLSNFTGPNATVIIDGGETSFMCAGTNCVFKNVVVLNGGVLSHYDTTANAVQKMDFTAEKVYVECGGKIDVSGKGYLTRYTYPNVQAYAASYGAGGSYGGEGGRSTATSDRPMPVYGCFMDPMDPGSGSGYSATGDPGGDGGGIVQAVVGTLIVDGEIIADGTKPGKPGAGGTINLDTGRISGSGTLRANGGAGGPNTGGGGRIAIRYGTNKMIQTTAATNVAAKSGQGSGGGTYNTGAAGTIYWLQKEFSTLGRLLIDNSGTSYSAAARPTVIPSVGTGIVGAVYGSQVKGTQVFPWSVVGLYLRIFESDGSYADYKITSQSDDLLTLEGFSDVNAQGKAYRGVIKLDAFDVRGDAILQAADLIEIHGDLSMVGSGRIDADVEVFGNATFVNSRAVSTTYETKTLNGSWLVHGDLAVGAYAALTHTAASAQAEYKLDLVVDGTLTVTQNGRIDLNGKGYLARRTYPNSIAFPAEYSSAGSYGGYGGRYSGAFTPQMPVYGNFLDPAEVGSGYGSDGQGVGGGAVRIHAGTLDVAGEIRADGVKDGTPGSGGSINLDVSTLKGTGSIHANGGGGASNSGGGGRIKVSYCDSTLGAALVIAAKGGMDGAGATGTGGAGTVYRFDKINSTYGRLTVDNTGITNSGNSRPTPLPSVGSGAILAIDGDVVTCRGDAVGWTAFPFSVVGLWLRFYDGTNEQGTFKILDQDRNRLTVEGLPFFSNPESLRYRGVVRLDSLIVEGGAYLLSDDIIETNEPLDPTMVGGIGASVTIQGDLNLAGWTGRIRELTVTGDLTLTGNSTLTVPDPSPWNVTPLTLTVGGALTIDASSFIDVSGKGYIQQFTYPGIRKYWGLNSASGGTGGGHGGLAGSDDENVLVLAATGENGWGRAVLNNPIDTPMTVGFDFKINTCNGGDGLVFMFYKDIDYSPQGGNSLAFGAGMDSPGYGLEINTEEDSAIAGAHVALVKDTTANHLAVETAQGGLTDGEWHHAQLNITEDGVQVGIDGANVIAWSGTLDRTHTDLGFTASSDRYGEAWDNGFFVDNLRIETGGVTAAVLEDDFSRPTDIWKRFEGKTYRNGQVVYGDVRNPSTPGSGGSGAGNQPGGGVIRIKAAGMTNQGHIWANGRSDGRIAGSGGSIAIQALSGIGGSGDIQADGADANGPGAGGRIALDGPVFMNASGITVHGGKNTHAAGSLHQHSDGAPGTIYYASENRLVVDATHNDDPTAYPNVTPLPRIGSGIVEEVSQDPGAPIQWFRAGGDPVTVPMSPYASADCSSFDPAGPASNAIDGKEGTDWLIRAQGYVYMDLGGVYPIASILWRDTARWNWGTQIYHISIAQNPDFSDAQLVESGTLPNNDTPAAQTLTMSEPLPLARFVIFYVDSWYGYGGGLDELEVFVRENEYALSTRHLFPGGHIVFGGYATAHYTVVGNDPLNRSRIFVEKGVNPDLAEIITPGSTTFNGVYQFDVIDVFGGAQLLSYDEVDCPGIHVDPARSGAALSAPGTDNQPEARP